MDHIINLPSNFTASTTQFASILFVDLSSPITLIIGVLLAVVILEVLIQSFRPSH